jgi:hypothetical protein
VSPTSLYDLLSDLGPDRQLVIAVAECHERTLERLAVHGAPHLNEAFRTEILGLTCHDDVGPSAFARALLAMDEDDRRADAEEDELDEYSPE